MKATSLIVLLASAQSSMAEFFRRLAATQPITSAQLCAQITTTGCSGARVSSAGVQLEACESCFIGNPKQCYTCSAGSFLYAASTYSGNCFATCTTSDTEANSGCLTPTTAAGLNAKLPANAGYTIEKILSGSCNILTSLYPIAPSACSSAATAYPNTPTSVAVACPSPAPPASDSKASCFSGSDTVTLETGVSKPLSEVIVGDRILSANAQGEFSFSEVIFLPHGSNDQETIFVDIATSSGKRLKATSMHLVQTCDGALAYAGTLKTGGCLRTVDGNELIKSASPVVAKGIYTAVTKNEFLVVGGFVASPFAVAHSITHAFYNIHRTLYELSPTVIKSPYLIAANAFVGSAVALSLQLFSASK